MGFRIGSKTFQFHADFRWIFKIFCQYSNFAPISTLQGAKPKVIYNPIGVFDSVHFLALDNTKSLLVRGTHCRHPIVIMGVVNHLGPSISSPCWRCHDFLNRGLAAVNYSFFQSGRVDYFNQLGLSLLDLKMFQWACNVDGKESCGYDECLLITSVLLCQENT